MEWIRHNRYKWSSISNPYFIRIKRVHRKGTKKGKTYLWTLHHDRKDIIWMGECSSVPTAKHESLAVYLEEKLIE